MNGPCWGTLFNRDPGGNSGGSSSIESKWEAAMEAELGEMDAEGRSDRPP